MRAPLTDACPSLPATLRPPGPPMMPPVRRARLSGSAAVAPISSLRPSEADGGGAGGACEAAIDGAFGPGRAMGAMDRDGALSLATRADQDPPPVQGRSARFGNDVWRDAHDLGCPNRRADRLAAWWALLGRTPIGARHAQARSGPIV